MWKLTSWNKRKSNLSPDTFRPRGQRLEKARLQQRHIMKLIINKNWFKILKIIYQFCKYLIKLILKKKTYLNLNLNTI